MSNHFAVATVSAALRAQVDEAANAALTGVSLVVETQRPDRISTDDGQAGVSVYLYQVSPNPSWRNAELATRRSDGSLVSKPQTALDLYYLLSFFGDEKTQQPERLLGGVVSSLHSRPLLTRQRIDDVVSSNAHLAGSDLAQQPELVRFVPLSLNLEELSKLWSVFFQTAYRLSVAYQASVVLIEPEDRPQPSLPVTRAILGAETLAIPTLLVAGAGGGLQTPVLPGGDLVIEGRNLRGAETFVHLGEAVAEALDVADTRIRVNLAEPPFSGSLRAGLLPVRVSHQRLLGPEGQQTPHTGLASNVLPVILRPVIRTGPGDVAQSVDPDGLAILTVNADPQIARDQAVSLLLNGPARSYALPARPRGADGNAAVFDLTDVDPGAYLLRLQVGGAESLLTHDANGVFVAPSFTVT
jgi:Pvc16 N-terminal domain